MAKYTSERDEQKTKKCTSNCLQVSYRIAFLNIFENSQKKHMVENVLSKVAKKAYSKSTQRCSPGKFAEIQSPILRTPAGVKQKLVTELKVTVLPTYRT